MTVLQRSAMVCVCACGGASLICATPSPAAEWLMTPAGRMTSDYTDNPRLLAEGDDAAAGVVGELQTRFERRTERSRLQLQPRVRAARYKEDESLDSDDGYLEAGYDFQTEQSTWSTTVGYTRDTTLTSEVDTTGIVQTNRRHEALSVSGGETWALTPRLGVGGEASWLDNRYPDAGFTSLVDYEYRSASLFTRYAMTERSLFTVTANAGDLVVPDRDSSTRNATLRLGWSYLPAKLWTLDVAAGPAFVESDFGSDDGVVYKLDVRRSAERWNFNASAGRDLTPTGRGILTRRDQIAAGVSRKFTEFVSGGVSVRGIRNQDLLPQPGRHFQDVQYGRVDLRLDWRIAQHWSVVLGLSAATQSYDPSPQSARNHRASLGIAWNGATQRL